MSKNMPKLISTGRHFNSSSSNKATPNHLDQLHTRETIEYVVYPLSLSSSSLSLSFSLSSPLPVRGSLSLSSSFFSLLPSLPTHSFFLFLSLLHSPSHTLSSTLFLILPPPTLPPSHALPPSHVSLAHSSTLFLSPLSHSVHHSLP